MQIKFDGKTALVTGASKGIGRDIAIQLAKCGAKVIGVAQTTSLLDELTKEVPSIQTITVDLSNWKDTEEKLTNIGPIDLLVNNAGLGWLKPFKDMTEEDIDKYTTSTSFTGCLEVVCNQHCIIEKRAQMIGESLRESEKNIYVFGVNTKGLMHVTQIAINNMLERNVGGSIVNLSSQASLAGLMNHTVYCASKGAVDAFTRAVALEYGAYNIRVNCVNPTVIMTDMGRLGWSDPAVARPMLDKIPLNRFGEVREVSDAVLYLLSDKSAMINGTCLPIDGGFLAC